MNRMAVATAGAALIVGCLLASPTAAHADSDEFRGMWSSIDGDGSSQWLAINGSGTAGLHSVRLVDDSVTVCGGSPATVEGQGAIAANTLTVAGVLTCRPGGNPLRSRLSVDFNYSPESDTLVDSFHAVWQRS